MLKQDALLIIVHFGHLAFLWLGVHVSLYFFEFFHHVFHHKVGVPNSDTFLSAPTSSKI